MTLHAGAVTEAAIREAVQKKALLYDKSGEEHYNLISALHKSLRDSDPDGALYWLGRMLEAGEDALYIARRLVRFASEDIGNADPQALRLALDAKESYHFLGSPEGELAPRPGRVLPRPRPQVQCRLRRVEPGAPGHTGQAGRAGAAASPQCPDGTHGQSGLWQGLPVRPRRPDAQVSQEHLPAALRGRVYYRPVDRGLEKDLAARLAAWRKWRESRERSERRRSGRQGVHAESPAGLE